MNTTTAIIGFAIGAIVVLAIFALMRRGSGDMIEQQRREAARMTGQTVDHGVDHSGALDNAKMVERAKISEKVDARDAAAASAVPVVTEADMIEEALGTSPSGDIWGEISSGGQRTGIETMQSVPEIRAAIAAGRKIEAIKLVREATGMGLKEAKDFVELAERRM